jgi:hypothetical protein
MAGFRLLCLSGALAPPPLKRIVKPMQSLRLIIFVLLAIACEQSFGAVETNSLPVPRVAITNLLASKTEYDGKRVEVRGYYFQAFETSRLSSEPGDHRGSSLWIHPFRYGAKVNRLNGKWVRIVGVFHHRKSGCGHMNAYPAELTDLELAEPEK